MPVSLAAKADILIMAAAVADYSPEHPSTEKIKKTTKDLQLTLQPTADILKTLAAKKKKASGCRLCSETNNEVEMQRKIKEKNADCIILIHSTKEAVFIFNDK